VLGFATVLVLVPLLLKLCPRGRLRRSADFHHAQQTPVLRLGGLALLGAFLAGEALVAFAFPELRSPIPGRAILILGSLAIFTLGCWDDFKPLGAKPKLAAQILIALAVCFAGIQIESFKLPFSGRVIPLHAWGIPLTVLWLVAITNLINLIDGVDGLAAGIALMLMVLLLCVGCQNGGFVLLTAGMAGAILAFLGFNFPPAWIYLGDGGAYLLGFQIALLSIIGSHKGSIFAALIAPLFVLALPIVDTGLAILRRGLRGLPVFRPDRRHIHHRLLSLGLSGRQVVLWLYALTLVFLAMAFVVLWSRGQLLPVLTGLALVVLLLCAGRLSFSRQWFAVGRTLAGSLAMRQQVQYALCLTRWLNLEAGRGASLEDLCADLACAAGRLGFTSGRLTLAGGQRCWEQPCHCPNQRSFRQKLPPGPAGTLELQAPACLGARTCALSVKAEWRETTQPAPCHQNSALFDLMAELVAEGWTKAANQSRVANGPLRFDSYLEKVHGTVRRPRGQPFPVRPNGRATRKGLPLGDDSVAAS
jgi:UDP-GlcNAc:undecaprenyl-phosphate GlcNAc-1-phosphate transferase